MCTCSFVDSFWSDGWHGIIIFELIVESGCVVAVFQKIQNHKGKKKKKKKKAQTHNMW